MTNSPLFVYTFLAGADMSAHKNKFVKISADQTVTLATAGTDAIIGVQDDIPFNAAGAQVAVRMMGTVEIIASAAIAAGAKVTSTGAGLGVTAGAGGDYHAIALEVATAANDLIECFLIKGKLT